MQPLLHVVERVHIGHIVDDADAVGATVVGGSDGSEALLSSRVPLQAMSVSGSVTILGRRTICSLTVFPSSSMVRIFCASVSAATPGRGSRRPYEVDTDRGDVALRVGVIGESKKQTRLSYTGVSNEQELEQVVVSVNTWLTSVHEKQYNDIVSEWQASR